MKFEKIPINLFFYLVLSLPLLVCAQKKFEWAKNIGGELNDHANDIKVAASGDLFITGSFSGTMVVDDTSLKSNGQSDAFVAKFSPDGTLQWVQQMGGKTEDRGTSLTLDYDGDVYVVGTFEGKADFDTASVTSNGGKDIFIARYSSSGIFQWVKSEGGKEDDEVTGITIDDSKNSYISGSFQSTLKINEKNYLSHGLKDSYVLKCDSIGNIKWFTTIGGRDLDQANAVSIDKNQNVYTTGYFSDTLTFSSHKMASNGEKDIFITKYNSDGQPVWFKQAGGKNDDIGNSIDVDKWDNIYLAGSFKKFPRFGDTVIGSGGSTDIFIAKYDQNGNFKWVQKGGGMQSDEAYAIAADNTLGGAYITGTFEGIPDIGNITLANQEGAGIFVAKCDSTGKIKWVYPAARTSNDMASSIDVDFFGSPYITGSFKENADFGKTTLLNHKAGNYDMFIAKVLPPELILPQYCDGCLNVIKIGGTNILPSLYTISYERALTKKQSFQLSFGFWRTELSQLDSNIIENINIIDDERSTKNGINELSHHFVIAEYRNYFSGKVLDGFYYSFHARMDYGTDKFYDYYIDSTSIKYNYIRSSFWGGLGTNVGYQVMLHKHNCWTLDLHIGLELNKSLSGPKRYYDANANDEGLLEKYPKYSVDTPYPQLLKVMAGINIGKAF